MNVAPRTWDPRVTSIREIESMTSFRLSPECHRARDRAFDWRRSVLVPPLIVLTLVPLAFAISPFIERVPILPLLLGVVVLVAGATYIHRTNTNQRTVLRRMSDEYAEWLRQQGNGS